MTPNLRKLALTAHIAASVGWLGAVAGFLACNIAGLTSQNAETVRGAYLAMNLIGRAVIVPLSLTALATGFIQALGTEWGLFRHLWVFAKLLLTIFSCIVLIAKLPLMGRAARLAVTMNLPCADLRAAGMQLLVHSAGGLLVLLMITGLSVFKPCGRTRYGLRKQRMPHAGADSTSDCSPPPKHAFGSTLPSPFSPPKELTAASLSFGLKVFLAVIGAVAAGLVVLHLAGGGLGPHCH